MQLLSSLHTLPTPPDLQECVKFCSMIYLREGGNSSRLIDLLDDAVKLMDVTLCRVNQKTCLKERCFTLFHLAEWTQSLSPIKYVPHQDQGVKTPSLTTI